MLRFQLCSACYTALQMKNSRRSASATIQSLRNYDDSCAPTTVSITALKVQRSLRFAFSYAQPITQRYKQRTVLESSLQLVQSPRKIRTIPFYKCTVGKPCIPLLRINTLDCQQKKWDTGVQ